MLYPSLKHLTILLASQSPRRRDLLSKLDIMVQNVDIDIEENYPPKTPAKQVAQYLSELKNKGYTEDLYSNEVLLTADTTVVYANKVLNKPKDLQSAVDMLSVLSGKTHSVTTGVTIRTKSKTISFTEETQVTLMPLSKKEIEHYTSNYEYSDKAGAYGIQDWIGYIGVKKISGCYYNVMGMPLYKVFENLKKIG